MEPVRWSVFAMLVTRVGMMKVGEYFSQHLMFLPGWVESGCGLSVVLFKLTKTLTKYLLV